MRFKATSGTVIHRQQGADFTIEVRENRDYRWLHFGDNAIQSAMSLSNPNEIVLPYLAPLISGLELLHSGLDKICILGLGGGSLYRYCAKEFPRADIDVVEIDQDVISIAKQFFKLPPTSTQHRIIQADANEYLAQHHRTFDIIISDIYSTHELPTILTTAEYYQRCFAALNKDGLLIINLVVNDAHELQSVVKIIKEVFQHRTLTIPLRHYHNSIIFAKKSLNFHQSLTELQDQGEITNVRYDFAVGYHVEDLTPRHDKRASLLQRLFGSS